MWHPRVLRHLILSLVTSDLLHTLPLTNNWGPSLSGRPRFIPCYPSRGNAETAKTNWHKEEKKEESVEASNKVNPDISNLFLPTAKRTRLQATV